MDEAVDQKQKPYAAAAFPIVGVGASAGGLAPTKELLHGLGDAPGLAVVVIHHLDPTHESSLVSVLSRATTLPVAAAVDQTRVEPNRVYVLPPDAAISISHGVLQVGPRLQDAGLHLPINHFFESLARDCDGHAVGVVLSGSGYDGAAGVKAIKSEGGLTLAQDSSSQFSSMPESAIATGCVDFIETPSGIARELRRLARQVPELQVREAGKDEDGVYFQILTLMRRSSGVDFAGYKQSTLKRRLARRMLFHGVHELQAYLEVLNSDAAEVGHLCEDALIHVTGFFRDREAFEALASQVLPALCKDRPRDSALRVWIPGCSTGEEVYSIAICALEFLEANRPDLSLKIFGTDLSQRTVEQARAGRYPDSIESDLSAARLQRFFVRDEQGYQIRREVRELCVFAKHDVARDPPFSTMDLISCRNLLIYLGPALQDRVLALFHYALNQSGFLLLGSAETVRAFAGFVAVDGKNKLYTRTAGMPRLGFDFTAPVLEVGLRSAGAGVGTSSRLTGQSDVQREADRLVLTKFGPPGVVVGDGLAIVQFRGQTGRYVEHAPGVASLDLLRNVRAELKLPLRRAIDLARASQAPQRESDILIQAGELSYQVDVEVVPFALHESQQQYFLVLFHEAAPTASPVRTPGVARVPEAGAAEAEARFSRELASARAYLESVIEQLEATNEELKAANEEVVSSNEELRSTNEELQSAKEELQATNEELRTVNDEMRERNLDAKRLSDDLTNVLTSSEIPMLIVGRDLRLRRFTPSAVNTFGMLPSHLGTPIDQLPGIATPAQGLASMVLATAATTAALTKEHSS